MRLWRVSGEKSQIFKWTSTQSSHPQNFSTTTESTLTTTTTTKKNRRTNKRKKVHLCVSKKSKGPRRDFLSLKSSLREKKIHRQSKTHSKKDVFRHRRPPVPALHVGYVANGSYGSIDQRKRSIIQFHRSIFLLWNKWNVWNAMVENEIDLVHNQQKAITKRNYLLLLSIQKTK